MTSQGDAQTAAESKSVHKRGVRRRPRRCTKTMEAPKHPRGWPRGPYYGRHWSWLLWSFRDSNFPRTSHPSFHFRLFSTKGQDTAPRQPGLWPCDAHPFITTSLQGQDNRLPTETWSKIARYLSIEPRLTTKDETIQQRRNLRANCLVSTVLCPVAMAARYEIIRIPNRDELELFHRAVKSHHEIGPLVRGLFVYLKLCWCGPPGERALQLCSWLFEVLETTTNLQFLSLDLQECTKCFRNSGPQDFSPNGKGANCKT